MGLVHQYGAALALGCLPVRFALQSAAQLLLMALRVTLDYATSTHHLSTLDPFAPSTFALSIPLPTAVSAFVIPHKSSANFFDLIERAELWRRLEGWGVGMVRVENVHERIGLGGLRMMGGVPT